jgi:hypothetical protein
VRADDRLTALHELAEAKAEIERHHRDFEKIREVLDFLDNFHYADPALRRVQRQIRNIIG